VSPDVATVTIQDLMTMKVADNTTWSWH